MLTSCKLVSDHYSSTRYSIVVGSQYSVQYSTFLQAVYSYLMTVPPTSVEAERAFSAAGLFVTKLRSRLGDNSIDTLCFLCAFYVN